MLNKISSGVILFTAVLLITSLLIKVWPVTVTRPNVQPYKVLTPKVRVGDQLVYVVDSCKYLKVTGIVSRSFVDGVRYPSITSSGIVKPGCSKTKVAIQVPNYVVPGIYHVDLSVQYQINPFRTDTYNFYTENFEVIGGE